MPLMVLAVAGCAGGPGAHADAPRATSATGPPVYTSDQLRQALLPEVATYARAGEPDSGPYSGLAAIRNFAQLQRQVVLNKPACAKVNQAFGAEGDDMAAPAALTTFARASGQTVTETLIAVPEAVAVREVARRVPSQCRWFKAKVGDQWSSHQVVEQTPDRHLIGTGSRTVGLVTMASEVRQGQRQPEKVAMWFVVFRSGGYLGTVSLYGADATKFDAERIARAAYDQAERILP
ncbi:hypothetical protein GCM10027589_19090 [Actinocorallia lasiicapitis]